MYLSISGPHITVTPEWGLGKTPPLTGLSDTPCSIHARGICGLLWCKSTSTPKELGMPVYLFR